MAAESGPDAPAAQQGSPCQNLAQAVTWHRLIQK